ncbi:hypothetical protein CC2G_001427 [Coprinopsis cinerea AmutBmut pab1-1]|nr:hypothetical protein CC2G_001427 [Coprinopsis cinerea AmutBmut pab1-1]
MMHPTVGNGALQYSANNTMPQSSAKIPASPDETVVQQLSVAKTVLNQAIDLLDNYLTSDDQLAVHSKYLPGSTIGKHLRHARDHFALLLDCMAKPPPHVLSYDTRIRNTPMETSRSGAKQALLDTIQQLDAVVPGSKFDQPLKLHAITPYMHEFESTFGREVGLRGCRHRSHKLIHFSIALVCKSSLCSPLVDGESPPFFFKIFE